jgi:hypothetical protein
MPIKGNPVKIGTPINPRLAGLSIIAFAVLFGLLLAS